VDIKVREICKECYGTSKNDISYHGALSIINNWPTCMDNRCTDEKVLDIQKCTKCNGIGYVFYWVPLEELVK